MGTSQFFGKTRQFDYAAIADTIVPLPGEIDEARRNANHWICRLK
jgi:hypothetical protein